MLHPVICKPLMVPAVRPADIVKWRAGRASYPDEAILYCNVQDGLFNAVEGLNIFQSSVLPTQYQRNADGSYTDVGANPAVDIFDGEKWLRSCGAVTNLFTGDASIARSVSLTARPYTLQVFGAGSVSCSYGTATVGSPLTFTAIVGSVTFTPTGATLWMLTATAYPVPYTPPGTTMPASNATTTNGCWFTLAGGSSVWKALTGQTPGMTLATRVRMGVGSGDLPRGVSIGVISSRNSVLSVQAVTTGSLANQNRVIQTNPSSGGTVLETAWDRNAIISRCVQVNTAATQYRVGYMIEGTHTTIQWGVWIAYSGSFTVDALYRLFLGHTNAYPMWFNKIAVLTNEADDATIMKALDGKI